MAVGKHRSERCLKAPFRFLLDRKPKESILGRLDVTVISRHFPEFCRATSRGSDGHALRFATIRQTTLGYLENVGYQFLSLHRKRGPDPTDRPRAVCRIGFVRGLICGYVGALVGKYLTSQRYSNH